MNGDDISSGSSRVVVLSRDVALAGAVRCDTDGAAYQCAGTSGPYEAAAELLAGPVLALVLDLRCLTPRHLRLLSIARENHVEVLAVGSLPFGITTTDLSGVRLTAVNDLPDELRRLARVGPAAARAPATGTGPAPEAAPEVEAPREPLVRAAPAGPPKQPVQTGGPRASGERPAHRPTDLLTDEELAALLEDRT